MKKILNMFFTVLALPLLSYEFVFPRDMPWSNWQAGRRLTVQSDGTLLKMSNIAPDAYALVHKLDLDASKITSIEIEYQLTGLQSQAPGQLYFLNSGNKNFSDAAKFNINGLKSDGKWHKLTLTLNNLTDQDIWRKGGKVTALRLDMTDSAARSLNIRKITFNDRAPKTASSALSDYPIPEGKLPSSPSYIENKAQFKHGMMAAKEDPPGAKTGKMPRRFLLRRTFDVPRDLRYAYIQYTADDSSALYLNGQKIDERRMYNAWKKTSVLNIKKHLRAGRKNVIVFDYSNFGNSGGVIMELIMHSRSGKDIRICSGQGFRGTVFSESLLQSSHSVSFNDSQWQHPHVYGVPPTPPWSIAIPYINFENIYQVTAQSKLPKQTYKAGEKISFSWKIAGTPPPSPLKAAIQLFDIHGKQIYETSVDLSDMIRPGKNNWTLNFSYKLPEYLSGRRMEIRLAPFDGFFGTLNPVTFNYQERVPAASSSNITQLKNDGNVQLIMDGQAAYPLLGNMHTSLFMQPFDISGLSKMPLSLRASPTTDMNYPWWFAPDKYDFDYVDWFACRALEENPDSKLIMWMTLRCPNWWSKHFGDEGIVWNDGTLDRSRFSFASDKVFKLYAQTIEKYIRHVENSPYRDRVAGYAINGGETVEWLGWQFNRTNGLKKATDYSPMNKKKFARFAAEKYPSLGSNAQIPRLEERFGSDRKSLLLTPEKDLAVIAYNEYHSWVIADFVIRLGQVARKALNGREKLLGCYYGYTFELPGMHGGSQLAGHRHLQDFLDSGIFQFIMSPPSYQIRAVGEPQLDMKPFTTLGKYKILSLVDDDTRTHTTPQAGFNQTLDLNQTRSVMRRNTALQLCRNLGVELLPLTHGNEFSSPEVIEDMTRVRAIGEHLQKINVPRQAEIAVVISEKTQSLLPFTTSVHANGEKLIRYDSKTGRPYSTIAAPVKFSGEALSWPRKTLSEVGAPVDYILAEDLKNNPGNYKLYIMLNLWSYDDELLAGIRKIQQQNTTILWMYAPGWIAGNRSSVENMQKLTGIQFKQLPDGVVSAIDMQDGSKYELTGAMLNPAFTPAAAAGVTVTGTYSANGQPAAAEWQNGPARQIFFGSYRLERRFVRRLAERLNIHLFNTDTTDFVEASSKLVMLHAATPGKKTLKFPARSTVVDLFEGKTVAENCTQYSWDAPIFDSKLFFYGTSEEAQDILQSLKK